MGNKGLKIYLMYTALLLLAGAAVLVVGNRFLNNYEAEQVRFNEEKKTEEAAGPTPSQEVVILEKYKYNVKIPASLELVGNNVQMTENNDGVKNYVIETESEGYEAVVRDAFGNEGLLKYGEKLETGDYRMVLPDNFRVVLKNGADASEYITGITEHEDYKWCYEYADMPKVAEYLFRNALAAPKVVVYDNLDNEISPEWQRESYIRTNQTTLSKIPEDVMSEEEAMLYVKTWSDFMTDDLKPEGFDAYIFTDKKTGERVPYVKGMDVKGLEYHSRAPRDHGFSVLKDYLLPNSYRYNALREFGYGDDIQLTSRHLPDPEYTNETITNFVMYTDNLFSVDVSFTKTIILPTLGYQERYDMTSVRVFFIKNPDGSSVRKWLMVDMITLEEKEVYE